MEARTSLPRRSQIVVAESIRGNRKEWRPAERKPAEIVFGYLNPSARANRYLSFGRAAESRRGEVIANAIAVIVIVAAAVLSRRESPFSADRRERRAAAQSPHHPREPHALLHT